MSDTKNPHVFYLAGLLFLLSGATSLGYEVAWVKLLTLHMGSASWSIATVVASFMAGLGSGSAWAGRRAERFRRPLLAYGVIELGIAAYGALSASILRFTSQLLDPVYGLIDGQFALFLVLQFLVSFISMAIPTFLMGASLPILITALAQQDTFRQRVAVLYGINTLGAALGTLAAGVFLLPALGIVSTLWVAAGAGVLVAVGAYALDRQSPSTHRPATASQPSAAPAAEAERAVPLPHLLLWTIGLAGSLGVGYQIAWTRLLVPVVGSSVYAFTIILTAVLVGIGAGALLAALPRLRDASYHRAVASAMGLGACSSVAGLFAVNRLPDMFAALAQWGGDATWLLFLCQGLLTACVLFVPACSLGAALPLGIAGWRSAAGSAGWAVGGMYAVNTLGAIAGSLLAGFVLLPLMGATRLVVAGAALGVVSAVALLLSQPHGRRSIAWVQAGALAALFAVSVLVVPDTDIARLQRGIFRGIQAGAVSSEYRTTLLYTEEGTSVTVTIFRTPNSTVLKVNGKADASTGGGMDTQYLLGHMPLLMHPSARTTCIIGYGSGATVHAVAAHPTVEQIDVVEIEQAVLNVSPYFHSINNQVLDDERVHVFMEDGRSFLRRRDAAYDIVISQPSNPWIAGIGSLFTTEHYQSVQERLRPGGLFCQWIQTYEISASTRQAMLHTLTGVFPYVTVFSIDDDLICLAANEPLQGSVEDMEDRLSVGSVAHSLARIQMQEPFDVFSSAYAQFPTQTEPFSSEMRNTDDNLWLEYRAPVEMYRGTNEPLAPVDEKVFRQIMGGLFADVRGEAALSRAARSIVHRYPERHDLLGALTQHADLSAEVRQDLRARSEEALALHSARQQSEARSAQASAHVRARRYADAVPLYEAILASDPWDNSAHRMLAWSLTRLGQRSRAWGHYEQALELNPDDFQSLTNMAAIALSSGKAEGIGHLDRALRSNPHHATAYRIYVQYLRDQRRTAEAREMVERARTQLSGEEAEAIEQLLSQ